MSLRFSAFAAAFSALVAVACSSPAPPEQPLVSVDALTNSAESSAAASTDCNTTTTQAFCVSCVASEHSAGASSYVVILRQAICAPDVCHAECATTYCATPQTSLDTKCLTCANAAYQTITQPVFAACEADAECKAFTDGLAAADCASKPNL